MKKILLLILLAAVPARAGVGVWTPFGPGEALVSRLAAIPGVLYAVMPESGIYRSVDGGESWQWWSLGMGRSQGIGVYQLAVDAAQPLALYAARNDGAIYRSGDGGRSWNRVPDIPDDPSVAVITVAGNGGVLYAGTASELWELRDGEWNRLLDARTWVIAFDPADPRTLYAGTESGLFKSTDGGLSWTESLPDVWVRSVAVAPSDPRTLYVATDGSWVSRDGGAAWTQSPLLGVFQFAVDPAAPAHVIAAHVGGLSDSTDAGATWHQTSPIEALSVVRDPGRPATLYAGTLQSGVLVSRDAGQSWRAALGRGLGRPVATLVESDPRHPGTVYLCHLQMDTCFRSLDGGSTWRAWNPIGLPYRPPLNAMAFDRRDPDVLYVAGYGIFRVEEGGGWQALPLPPEAGGDLVGVASSRGILVTGGDAGVYRSLNRGLAWKKVLAGDLQRLIQDPNDPAVLYAIVLEPPGDRLGIYRSLDTGGVWARILADTRVLAVDPSRPRILYTVRGGRTWRSQDRGGTWKPLAGAPPGTVMDLAVHPESPSTLLAATWGEGVRISRDGGRTWGPYNVGLARPGIEDILKLYADPVEPGRFFALPASGGVFEAVVP